MDTGFIPIGFIELACDQHRLDYYRRVAAFNRFCGVQVEELTPHQVKDKFPLLDTQDVLAGFYVHDDGRANPYDVTMVRYFHTFYDCSMKSFMLISTSFAYERIYVRMCL